MTPAGRFQAAIILLEELAQADRPADGVVNAFVRARRYMGSKDRHTVTRWVWGVVRTQARLVWRLKTLEITPTPRACLLAWFLLVEKRKVSDLDIFFPVSPRQYDPKPMSIAEKNWLADLEGKALVLHTTPMAIRYELPDWLYDCLTKTFGEEGVKNECAAMLEEAPLDLRVNVLKTTRDESLKALSEEGIDAKPGTLSPWALRVDGRPNVAATGVFQNGLVEVQDEGSQMIAWYTNARPGMGVLDLCAGAGGKTLALAAMMGNRGSLIATDISPGRLERARVRLQRAGAHNVTCKALDGDTNKWLKRRKGTFDSVLVDAPCSGTGTFRRNPDARWRLKPADIHRLQEEQANLLDRAGNLVKPGGRLVYATCSVLPVENEDRINAFLATHSQFHLEKDEQGNPLQRRFTPYEHGTDGFFVAVMTRTSDA